MNDLSTILNDLYKSEINFTLSTFYDAGYTVQMGDNWNGFKAESEMLDTLDEVASELIRLTKKLYPEADFSKKYFNKTIVFCPECSNETFEVEIKDSGSGFNSSFGCTEHWFTGDGKCSECGHESEYSDSSL